MQEDLKIAKEYLLQAYRLSKQIDYDLQELMRLEELAVSIQAVNYSERVQSSNSKDIIDCIEKIDSARKSINAKIIQYSSRVDCIKGTIGKIENRGIYDVLWERYILFKKWEDIADELGYCLKHIYKIHRKGLEEISKILQTCD